VSEFVRSVQIDQDGYFLRDGVRLTDAELGQSWLRSLQRDEKGRHWLASPEGRVLVEAFDAPYVVRTLGAPETISQARDIPVRLAYGLEASVPLKTLRLDDFDRVHARITWPGDLAPMNPGVLAVFSRTAQAELFDRADELDDDSLTWNGQRQELHPLYDTTQGADAAEWWSELYRKGESRWDLDRATPVLDRVIQTLKPTRCRVAVLGCGRGHDAAWWSQHGHLSQGFDLSEDAIAAAKRRYGESASLQFHVADVLDLPRSWDGQFDMVFDHTLYCAVHPQRRSELVQVWRRLLAPDGLLVGVFFAMDRPIGPPYGGTEWELHERLRRSSWESLYWQRTGAESPRERQGREFLVVARKRASSAAHKTPLSQNKF
jgi:SAM-dependent methyltransferase